MDLALEYERKSLIGSKEEAFCITLWLGEALMEGMTSPYPSRSAEVEIESPPSHPSSISPSYFLSEPCNTLETISLRG